MCNKELYVQYWEMNKQYNRIEWEEKIYGSGEEYVQNKINK